MVDQPHFGAFDTLVDFHFNQGCYVLFQIFADSITGTNHRHDVTVQFSPDLVKAKAKIAYSRNDNIDQNGTAYYEGVFLLKLPHLSKPDKNGGMASPAFTLTLSGAYYQNPPVENPQYGCGAVVSQGWVGPNWGDTDGVWRLMTQSQYNTLYVDAYFDSLPPDPQHQNYNWQRQNLYQKGGDGLWWRPAGSEIADPRDPQGWHVYYFNQQMVPCSFTPPSGGAPQFTMLPFSIFAFVYPLKNHFPYPADTYTPIRKSLKGSISDAVDLWDILWQRGQVVDGKYPIAVERRRYLQSSKSRKVVMLYPTAPLLEDGNVVEQYKVTGFRMKDDGFPIVGGQALLDAGGTDWIWGVPSGPPLALLSSDPLAGEK